MVTQDFHQFAILAIARQGRKAGRRAHNHEYVVLFLWRHDRASATVVGCTFFSSGRDALKRAISLSKNSMGSSNDRVGQLFLRYALPLAGLRHVPVLGPFVRWASEKVVPRDSLAWVQIQQGPAKGLWLRLNPRTGGNYFQGGGEPEVQKAMQRHLRPGMTFYDIGANIGFFFAPCCADCRCARTRRGV